jgi:hypothetical protein
MCYQVHVHIATAVDAIYEAKVKWHDAAIGEPRESGVPFPEARMIHAVDQKWH